MDQTRGVDRTKPLGDQMISVLWKRFEVPGIVVGGDMQYYKKAALALISLAQDYYYKHPEELKPYTED